METKKCPACGYRMPMDAKDCPFCGLEGQNQIFLSQESRLAWVEQVLKPHMEKMRPPQVFVGPNHALILLENGDLYAIGNNYNESCGSHLPQELKEPMRIAREVQHAAASQNHTLYVTRDGQAVLLGNSELTDRFSCTLHIRRVYANPYREAFLLEDEQGALYFFGENDEFVPREEQVLRTLPDVLAQEKSIFGWWEPDGYCTQKQGWYTHRTELVHVNFHSACNLTPEEIPELQEVRQSDWYRELAQTHGERNIRLRLGLPVQTETLESKRVTTIYGVDNMEDMVAYVYRPEVVWENNVIYQPVLCDMEGKMDECLEDCWPHFQALLGWHPQDFLPDAVKVMTGSCDELGVFQGVLAYLDGQGMFRISSRRMDLQLPELLDIADFAVNTREGHEDYILLVTRQREVLLGSKQELAASGSWDHLKKLHFNEQ